MTTQPDHDTSFGGWRACDVCGEPIGTTAEAALALRGPLFEERRANLANPSPEKAPDPGLVPWDWGHRECVDAMEPMHVVPGDQIDTLPRMMARTLQLLDEPWFLETAWEDAVRRFYRIPLE